jgi:hypothetical protein
VLVEIVCQKLNAIVKSSCSSVSWKRSWRDVDVQRSIVDYGNLGSHPGSIFSHTVLSCYVPVGVADSRLWGDISCLKGQRTWMKKQVFFSERKTQGKEKLYI